MGIGELEDIARTLKKTALINFAVFTIIAFIIGGTAFNGYISNGHYYLSMNLGGHATEVSYPVFLYSQIHTYFLVINYVLFIILTFVYLRAKGKKK
jgi:hypothetical protein